jgi:GT2 family glycosyltransferase
VPGSASNNCDAESPLSEPPITGFSTDERGWTMPFSNKEIHHISVIVITYNRKEDLQVCLDSVLEQTHSSYEVIVVDNNSTDGTATMMREDYDSVHYVRLDENIGIDARNRAIDEASGDLLLTLDDDSELPNENVLDRVGEKFRRNDELGAAGFRIINEDGREEEWFEWPKVGDARQGFKSPTFVTCGAAIRPEAYERTEGFWAPYFVYVEERDLATRIIASGAEIRYFPNISIIHHRSSVNRQQGKFIYFVTRNTIWYIWRNFPVLTALRKTVTHVGRMSLNILRKQEGFGIFLKGLIDAVGGLWKALRSRDPIERKHLDWVDGRFEAGDDEDQEES